jgi:hypothetical protein
MTRPPVLITLGVRLGVASFNKDGSIARGIWLPARTRAWANTTSHYLGQDRNAVIDYPAFALYA